MSTEHEARARRAKAVALATVLADQDLEPADVAYLPESTWRLAAEVATQRQLLGTTSTGKPRTVHPPHSAETVAAVERELRMLQVEQRVDVEQPRTDAGRPGQCPHGQAAPRSADGTHCNGCGLPLTEGQRRATDSAGYRAEIRRLVPAPNTSDPFAGFPR